MPTDEKVEKVARAICRAYVVRAWPSASEAKVSRQVNGDWTRFSIDAQAAIAALEAAEAGAVPVALGVEITPPIGRDDPVCRYQTPDHRSFSQAYPASDASRDGLDAWSDIASAPKDGTWVLLKGGEPDECYDFDAPKPPCVVAQWVDVSYSDGRPGSGRWYFAHYDSGYYGRWLDPTHWRSLASPPSEAPREERAVFPIIERELVACLEADGIECEQDGHAWTADVSRRTELDVTGIAVAIATAIRARGG